MYDIFGTRVPAIFVAASIATNTILRPPSSSAYPFDHTAVIATLNAQFGLDGPLTTRDGNAPMLENLASPTAAPRRLEVDLQGRTREAETGTTKDTRRSPAHGGAMGPCEGREARKTT